MIVFKLNPGAAIRNDLGNVQRTALKEDAGRTVKLRNDDALGTVDDEGAIVGHQRNLAKEHLLFLDVANRHCFSFRILIVNREANLHLERHTVTHAPLLAFLLIVLVLQPNRLAAVLAQVRSYKVKSATFVAQRFACRKRIHFHRRTALLAVRPQVIQAFKPPALTLPVADLILDEIECRRSAKIRDRKDRLKDRL